MKLGWMQNKTVHAFSADGGKKMDPTMLLQWHYLIFLLPGAVSALLLVLSSLRFGHRGGHIGGHGHVGLHGHAGMHGAHGPAAMNGGYAHPGMHTHAVTHG